MWKQLGKKMWKIEECTLESNTQHNDNHIIKNNSNLDNNSITNDNGSIEKHIHFNEDEIKEWDKFRGTFTKIQEPKTP